MMPLPLSPLLFHGEDNACYINADRSPTASAHAVCWVLKACVLLDQPLPAGPAGGKDGKGKDSNDNGNAGGGSQELDCTQDQDAPPLSSPPPSSRQRNGNKGGGQVKAKATKRAIMMAMRVVSNNEGDCNGDEGGRQATARRGSAAAMTVVGKDEGGGMAMRVVGDKEGEVIMALEMVKRMAGKQWQRQQRWQWQWQ
jgi:hypothetical protein